MIERRCVNCRFFLMHTSMRAIKEPYCKLRGKWIGGTIVCSKWEQRDKPTTNADRIRAMTDEELATWVYTHRWNDLESIIEWLKQEATDEHQSL